MYNRILVPLDGSALAERALPHAEALARSTGAGLVLVRAVSVRSLTGGAPSEPVAKAVSEAEAYLGRLVRELAERDVYSEISVPYGDAAWWIVEEAQARNVGAIVMSTHGRSGMRRWVYGSTSQRVLERSPVPILLTRSWQAGSEPGAAGGRLLVPLDGSASSEAALPVARELARLLGAGLTLLRVAPEPGGSLEVEAMAPAYREEARRARQEEAERYLLRRKAELDAEGLETRTELRVGEPPRVIAAVERELGAAMTIMATHGRTGARRLLMGSVAHSLMRLGGAPLLLVRPEQFRGAAEAHPELAVSGATRLREVEPLLPTCAVVVRAEDRLTHVAEAAARNPGARVICVVRPGDRLVGLIPAHDLARLLGRRFLAGEPDGPDREPGEVEEQVALGNVLPPDSVRPEHTVREALERMQAAGLGGLPVTDPEGRVVGYVDQLELLLSLERAGARTPAAAPPVTTPNRL